MHTHINHFAKHNIIAFLYENTGGDGNGDGEEVTLKTHREGTQEGT
jgi:hypothetical protein